LKSELKTNIILSLLNGEKKLAGLKEDVSAQGPTILHTLRELEDSGVTTRFHGVYRLTSLGIIEAQVCKEHKQSLGVIEKHKDFWLTHDVSGIPAFLMTSIGALEESIIIKATDIDFQRAHNNFIELLRSAKAVYGISPIFHPEFIVACTGIMEQGNKIELIVNQTILDKIRQEANELLNRYIANGTLQVFLSDKLTCSLTVTEQALSLGLFKLSGEYDFYSDLVCNTPESVEWGQKLFKHIRKQSTKI
jgi:predicted transcriptional regulator